MVDTPLHVEPFGSRPIICVASGPSVTLRDVWLIGQARAADRCRVIAVSDNMFPCWFADVGYSCDRKWWESKSGVQGFPGMKVSLEITGYHDVIPLRCTGPDGYDRSPGCIRSGMNSGYQAVHLAANLGAETIVLVGYDFTEDGARDHWFGLHDSGMDRHSDVPEMLRLFKGLTTELHALDVTILNTSRQSSITWLPRRHLDEIGQ